MKKKGKNDKNLKIGLIVFGTFILVVFNVYFYMNNANVNTDYNSIKESNKKIVYTRYSKKYENIETIVPYINLKTDIIGDLNNQIAELANNYLVNDNNVITYDYRISGDILSVVIQINCYNEQLPKVYFETYNINLKEKRILEDREILNLFGVDETYVSSAIENKFKEFFRDEREKGIFDEECDYNCFLYMRGFNKYTDNIHYYVDDAKLYVYKEFNVYSIYDEDKYYENEDFKIAVM